MGIDGHPFWFHDPIIIILPVAGNMIFIFGSGCSGFFCSATRTAGQSLDHVSGIASGR
ncbi:hypothetical protein NC651_003211 [Populus alba x Populus x berolinensis]|nr:hypothetical protein NC651_003211 [Populus alba x Populus x berolinensis]